MFSNHFSWWCGATVLYIRSRYWWWWILWCFAPHSCPFPTVGADGIGTWAKHNDDGEGSCHGSEAKCYLQVLGVKEYHVTTFITKAQWLQQHQSSSLDEWFIPGFFWTRQCTNCFSALLNQTFGLWPHGWNHTKYETFLKVIKNYMLMVHTLGLQWCHLNIFTSTLTTITCGWVAKHYLGYVWLLLIWNSCLADICDEFLYIPSLVQRTSEGYRCGTWPQITYSRNGFGPGFCHSCILSVWESYTPHVWWYICTLTSTKTGFTWYHFHSFWQEWTNLIGRYFEHSLRVTEKGSG